jgi:geranylgeranyl diphosphate synthase type 3
MVLDKTGGLFRLAAGLMQCFSTQGTSLELTPLLNTFALYYQIRDDYLNLFSAAYMRGKSFCEDLSEGKFSFPIIHALQRGAPGDSRLLNVLRQVRYDKIDDKMF